MIDRIMLILESIKGHKKHFYIIIAIIIIASFMESFSIGLLAPVMQGLINKNISSGNIIFEINKYIFANADDYKFLLFEIMMLLLVSNMMQYIRKVYQIYLRENIRKEWRIDIYRQYIGMDYTKYVLKRQGEMINNIISETERGAIAIEMVIELISNIFITIAYITVMFVTSFNISIVVAVGCILVYVITKKLLFNYSEQVGTERIKILQDMNSQVSETINGIIQLKLFNMDEIRLNKFIKTNKKLAKLIIYFVANRLIPVYGLKLLALLIGIMLFTINSYFKIFELETVIPLAATFFVVTMKLFENTSNLLTHVMNILNYIPSLKLTNSIITSIENEKIIVGANNKVLLTKVIEFKNITYRIANKIILDDVSIKLDINKKSAIVGTSGSGKTSLIYLLLGIYKIQEGSIMIDGISVEDIDKKYLRDRIGVVSQDNYIFNGTIRDNILMGRQNIDEKTMIEASKKANADEFIGKMENGYDTLIGDKGLNMSGGQRQRISIARVILKNPDIMIFDEATNALDKESERLVIESINTLSKEKAVIMVTHDLALMSQCDKIVFIKDGKNAEEGTSKELIDKKGEYWKLHRKLEEIL